MSSDTASGEEAVDGDVGSATAADVPEFESDTSTGLDENILGVLAYVFGIVSGVAVYVLESDNEFAKFHGAQSAVFSAGVLAINFALMIFSFVFTLLGIEVLSFLVNIGIWLFMMAFGFATFLAWLYLLFKAYQGERTKIPVIGNLVEKNLV